MQAVAQAFFYTLLNSLWQAGLLYVCFVLAANTFLKATHPHHKRNFLLAAACIQLLVSSITFVGLLNGKQAFSLLPFSSLTTSFLQNLIYWILPVYFLLALYKGIKLVGGFTLIHKSKKNLQKAPVDIRLFTNTTAKLIGIRRRVTVWLSTNIQSPLTYNHLRPVIVLPVSLMANISMQQAEALILHELSHIKANDFIWNLFIALLETVFFFNPFILAICSQIKMQREKSCDTTVINFSYPPVIYAEALLAIERLKKNPALIFAADNKQALLKRIEYFTQEQELDNKRTRTWSSLLFVTFIALLLTFFSLAIIGKNNNGALAESPSLFIPIPDAEIPETVQAQPPVDKSIDNNNATVTVSVSKKAREKDIAQKIITEKRVFFEERPGYTLSPVAAAESDVISNEIIVEEEVSGSKTKTVKVYQLSFDGKQWVLQPVAKVTAKQKLHDSSVKDGLPLQSKAY